MEKPKCGSFWRHYKSTGGVDHTYKVHGVVIHSETQEEMVLYEMLYDHIGDDDHIPFPCGTLFVRPLSMWYDIIEYEGTSIERFIEI